MKPKTLDVKSSRSSAALTSTATTEIDSNNGIAVTDNSDQAQFVVCLDNKSYEVSLEKHKLYRVIPDVEAAEYDEVRIVDESGEDYLFPARRFAALDLPPSIQAALTDTRQ